MTSKATTTHDSMVEMLVTYLVANGFTTVRGDLNGHVSPTKITWTKTGLGHIPDATAFKGSRQHIFEVETEECLFDQHTADQLRLFGAYASQHNATFCLVVPKASEAAARALLRRLSVVGDVWTIGSSMPH